MQRLLLYSCIVEREEKRRRKEKDARMLNKYIQENFSEVANASVSEYSCRRKWSRFPTVHRCFHTAVLGSVGRIRFPHI